MPKNTRGLLRNNSPYRFMFYIYVLPREMAKFVPYTSLNQLFFILDPCQSNQRNNIFYPTDVIYFYVLAVDLISEAQKYNHKQSTLSSNRANKTGTNYLNTVGNCATQVSACGTKKFQDTLWTSERVDLLLIFIQDSSKST